MTVDVERRAAQREETIKILLIDDNPIDAELNLMALRRGGVRNEYRIAGSEAELRSVLEVFAPDLILCDFRLPDLDGFAAQALVRDAYPGLPLIFVTGAISEELAVVALKSGAVDYVLKSNLLRLPMAATRAVQESRERRRLEFSLEQNKERSRQHAARLETLWRIANNADVRGQHLILAMLEQAARDIRPGQHFDGVLGVFDGADVLVVGATVADSNDVTRTLLTVGTRTPVIETFFPRGGRTQSTEDLAARFPVPERQTRLGWRAAISTQFEACGLRYSLSFGSLEPAAVPFGQEDTTYLDVLAMSFANQMQVTGLERSLRDEEETARTHAERLEALWKIANDPALRDQDLWLALLGHAAASIWPSQGARGSLWRVRDADMVLEAVVQTPDSLLGEPLTVGESIPLESSIVSKVIADGGGTQVWDDLQTSPDAQDYTNTKNLRAVVLTTFSAGGSTWILSFASGHATPRPLGPQERAYIEVIASFFSNHMQQRWQYDRIAFQQSHDVLTGLLNRSQFRSQARAAARTSADYAILVVDVNAFREINESYGHMIGDALLVEIGTALAQRANDGEIVGRVGGDVFAVYLPQAVSRTYVQQRAQHFSEVFEQPFSTGDRNGTEFIARTASVGIAMAPDDGASIDAILAHADAALLAAKERGLAATAWYEPGMESDAPRRATLRNEIAQALAEDQFTLFYQPHVDLNSGRVSGCEALIRWNHPTRGLILPGHFIPFAEQTGLITSIDEWVMRRTFAVASELGGLRPGFRTYFNLSGRQAGDAKLVRAFTNAARSGVPLASIGVEITESDAMRDVEATRRVCRALRRLNVKIAIDDFGTGYSSLSSLKRLPVDIVKIDRSFISGVLTDPHDETIADTIISISARFGFESLAEGVEQLGEIGWLRERPCTYMQGYAICHPLPLDQFKSWLADYVV